MSVAEKEELQRKEIRFRAMSPAEQERLRQLHEQISAAADAERLQEVMLRYHSWLKTLRPGQRAELLSLPADERISRIRSIIQEQSIQRVQRFAAHKLEPPDVDAIRNWIGTYLTKREAEILATMSEKSRQDYEAETDPASRRRRLAFTMVRSSAGGDFQTSPEEVQDLVSRLSRDAQRYLEEEKDPRTRAHIVRTWIVATIFSEYRRPVSNEELRQFVENELPESQREFLDSLPTERFRREAERLYNFHRRSRWGREDGGPENKEPRAPYLRGPR
jgi:hypothetical protein